MTYSDFITRLSKHKSWLSNYEGEKFVRFGRFKKPYFVSETLVKEIESAFIYEHQPPKNQMQKSSYTTRRDYLIESVGRRGLIRKVIDTRNHS